MSGPHFQGEAKLILEMTHVEYGTYIKNLFNSKQAQIQMYSGKNIISFQGWGNLYIHSQNSD